ncbi:12693_t:CDS:2 [Acaulospora colombiana]|uniref:12693_t:CDS:1 n=1 Tax=Acaulospora colombiana TaxID=27376 RepID=A0ACA9KSV2_9GLOM|nr:12693_t:CDS:2 [Acaulospora colombiana]
MGPSGAGKSSFLDLLAGRKDPRSVTGEILLNGRPGEIKYVSTYVMQDDALMGNEGVLSVRENIQFAADLCFPGDYTRTEKETRVQEIMEEFGLERVADSKIGTVFVRGVSGGEKRRCAVASQIITLPWIIFLDEPTTGLDSAAAYNVMKAIKDMAQSHGLTVIASIHQPSTETYSLFDKLLLLGRGKTLYFGEREEALEYFESLGYACPPYSNPADHFLTLVNSDFMSDLSEAEKLIKSFNEAFKASEYKTEIDHQIKKITEECLSDESLAVISSETSNRYARNFFAQTFIIMNRSLKNAYRNVLMFWIRVAMYVALAILMGSTWWQVGYEQKSVQDRFSAHFFSVAFLVFMSVAGIPGFLEERLVFQRERANGFYSVGPYVLANTLISIPFVMIIALSFGGTDGVKCYNDLWCYDTHKNYWSEILCGGATPLPRESHCASLVDDVIYIFGGRTIEGKDLADLAAFNINQKRWFMFQKMGPSPCPRYCHSMTLLQKKILVFGGDSSQTAKPNGEGTIHILDTARIKYPTSTFPGEMPRQRYHKRSLSEPPISLSPQPTPTRAVRQNPLFAKPQASLTNLQISVSKGNTVEDLIPTSSLINRLQNFSRKPRTLDDYPIHKFSSFSVTPIANKSPDITAPAQTTKPKILRVRPGGPKRQLKNPLLGTNVITPSVDKGKTVDRGVMESSNLMLETGKQSSFQPEVLEHRKEPNVENSYDENHVEESELQRTKGDEGSIGRERSNSLDETRRSIRQSPSHGNAKIRVPEDGKGDGDIFKGVKNDIQKQGNDGENDNRKQGSNSENIGNNRRRSQIVDQRLIHAPNEESRDPRDSRVPRPRSIRMTSFIDDISLSSQDDFNVESSASPLNVDKNIPDRSSMMLRNGGGAHSSRSDDRESYSGALLNHERESYMERLQEQDLKIAEMKKRETWFKAKLALAKRAGFLLEFEGEDDADIPEGIDVENLMDIGEAGSEKFKVIEAIVQLSQQLKQAKETIVSQSKSASQKISEFEKMYKAALEEVAVLKSKFTTLYNQLESERLSSDKVQNIRAQLSQKKSQIEKSKRVVENAEAGVGMMRRVISRSDFKSSGQNPLAIKFKEIAERCDELEELHEIAQRELKTSISKYRETLKKAEAIEENEEIVNKESSDIGSSSEYRVKTPSSSSSVELGHELRVAETKAERTQLQLKQLKQKLSQVESDYQTAVKYAQNTEKLLQKVKDELTQSKKDIDNLNRKLVTVETSNVELEEKLYELQKSIDKHDNIRNSILQEYTNQQLLEQKVIFFQEREQLQQRIVDLQTKISNAQDEKSLMDQGYEALRRVYESLRNKNDTLRKSNEIFKQKTLESEKMSEEVEQELERTILLSKQESPMEPQEVLESSSNEQDGNDQSSETGEWEEERKILKDQVVDFQVKNRILTKNKSELERKVMENEGKVSLLLDQMENVVDIYRVIEGEISAQDDASLIRGFEKREKSITPEMQDEEESSLLSPKEEDEIEDMINRAYPDLTNFVLPEYPTSPMSSTTEGSEYTTFGKREDPDYFELDRIDEEDTDELEEAGSTEKESRKI